MFERFLRPWRRDAAPLQLEESLDRATMDAANNARMDSWQNKITGLGGKNDLACRNSWRYRAPLDMYTLESIYEFSEIGGRMVDQEPDDSTREGFELVGIDREDQDALNERLGKIGYLQAIAEAQRWANLYGGAAVYMQVQDGQTSDMPIDMARIVTVSGLTVLDRWDLTAQTYDTDPDSKNFGNPELYQMSVEGGVKSNAIIHASRLLPFYGKRLPWRAQRRRQGWGSPVYDRAWEAFEAYGSSHSLLKNALARITQGVIKSKGLDAALKKGQKKQVKGRMQALTRDASMLGDMFLDMDKETYEAVQRGVQGFKDVLEAFENYLVAHTPIPKSILLGQTPGGLNSGANSGDWEAWAGYISAQQTKKLDPPTRRFLDIEFASTNTPLSEIPESYKIKWNPILQESKTDKADNHFKNAQARQLDVFSGIVTDDQARRQDDVQEAYKLTEEEIAEGEDEDQPSQEELAEAAQNVSKALPGRQRNLLKTTFPGAKKEQLDAALRVVDG